MTSKLFKTLMREMEHVEHIKEIEIETAFEYLISEHEEDREYLKTFKNEMESFRLRYWGYFNQNSLIGIISSHDIVIKNNSFLPKEFISKHKNDNATALHSLHIKKDFRRKGLGGVLVSFFCDMFKDELILLQVDNSKKNLIQMYEKYGFKEAWKDKTNNSTIMVKENS